MQPSKLNPEWLQAVVKFDDQRITCSGPKGGNAIRWDELKEITIQTDPDDFHGDSGMQFVVLTGSGSRCVVPSCAHGFGSLMERIKGRAQFAPSKKQQAVTKKFQFNAPRGPAITTPVHDGPVFSAICKVVGTNSGTARPYLLTYFLGNAPDVELFEQNRQDPKRYFKVGDEVMIEFSKAEVVETGVAQHMLVMSVNGQVRQEWGTWIGDINSLVVQWRSRGANAVLDCVPCKGDPDLSQLGSFLALPSLIAGERVVFSIAGSEPKNQPPPASDKLPAQSSNKNVALSSADKKPWWKLW